MNDELATDSADTEVDAQTAYRGYGPEHSTGGRLVVVTVAGDVIGPLPHRIRHSPTGMTWGYGGSGPADLARSLLIHALGAEAVCETCSGTTVVVYDTVTNCDIPAARATDEMVSLDGTPQPRYSDSMRCAACQDGYTVPESLCQQYKWDVVAHLPDTGWEITRTTIRDWVAHSRGML